LNERHENSPPRADQPGQSDPMSVVPDETSYNEPDRTARFSRSLLRLSLSRPSSGGRIRPT
jgi:hypothetical protein